MSIKITDLSIHDVVDVPVDKWIQERVEDASDCAHQRYQCNLQAQIDELTTLLGLICYTFPDNVNNIIVELHLQKTDRFSVKIDTSDQEDEDPDTSYLKEFVWRIYY